MLSTKKSLLMRVKEEREKVKKPPVHPSIKVFDT